VAKSENEQNTLDKRYKQRDIYSSDRFDQRIRRRTGRRITFDTQTLFEQRQTVGSNSLDSVQEQI